jgi:hypothetical protein
MSYIIKSFINFFKSFHKGISYIILLLLLLLLYHVYLLYYTIRINICYYHNTTKVHISYIYIYILHSADSIYVVLLSPIVYIVYYICVCIIL